MKIEDVKQWQCGNGLAVAVNPYWMDFSGILSEDDRYVNWAVFEDWRLNIANQPITYLDGIFNAEQVKEVWEYNMGSVDDNKWHEENFNAYNQFQTLEDYTNYANSIEDPIITRRRLVLAEPKVTNKTNIKMNTIEVTKEQQLKYLQEFANKHKLVLELNGECGFGRKCVGMQHGDLWVSYNPTHSQTCEDIESVYDERHYDIAAPNAYHKFNCLAVLGQDDSAILELYEWCLKLDELECTIETYQTGATGMQVMFSGVTGKALKLNKPQ